MNKPALIDNGKLIYEKSKSGRVGYTLPELSTEEAAILSAIPAKFRRSADASLPEVTEPEAMRHFVNLSVKNHHIDKGFYPLGSCTMKYNPKLNDAAASIPGIRNLHPLTPQKSVAGLLKLMWGLSEFLKEVSGFKALSLQPVAGAAGEFAGLLIMRKHHGSRNENRTKIIIPQSAHGTNPATVSAVGFTTVQIPASEKGVISPHAVAEAMDEQVAGLMTTNPNTLGIFESNVKEIAEIVHSKGGLMYMDGANLNANMGIFRPGDVGFDMMHFNLHKTFSTPHGGGGPGAGAIGVTAALEKYLPFPHLEKDADGNIQLNFERPDSIGRLHSFYGNFGNMVRAYCYILSYGGEGLKEVSENAVLNANYLKTLLKDIFDLPYDVHCMHEFVISGKNQKKLGVRTHDISKRLLDYGVHPPTVYFPLIVPEAMMVEPTETESKETLDFFAQAMKQIDEEARTSPDVVTNAPYTTPVRRLDEASAARNLDVAYLD